MVYVYLKKINRGARSTHMHTILRNKSCVIKRSHRVCNFSKCTFLMKTQFLPHDSLTDWYATIIKDTYTFYNAKAFNIFTFKARNISSNVALSKKDTSVLWKINRLLWKLKPEITLSLFFMLFDSAFCWHKRNSYTRPFTLINIFYANV